MTHDAMTHALVPHEALRPVDLLTTTASLSVAPSPSPSPGEQEELDASTVTPGLLGFLVTFAVVLACIPLFRSMTTKLRGVERRAMDEAPGATDGGASTAPHDGPAPYDRPAPQDGGVEPR